MDTYSLNAGLSYNNLNSVVLNGVEDILHDVGVFAASSRCEEVFGEAADTFPSELSPFSDAITFHEVGTNSIFKLSANTFNGNALEYLVQFELNADNIAFDFFRFDLSFTLDPPSPVMASHYPQMCRLMSGFFNKDDVYNTVNGILDRLSQTQQQEIVDATLNIYGSASQALLCTTTVEQKNEILDSVGIATAISSFVAGMLTVLFFK